MATAKTETISLRLPHTTNALIDREARRTRRSKSALVTELTEESLKARVFPGIAFRSCGRERRAFVLGTGLDVWEIVDSYRSFDSPEAMSKKTDLTARQINLALTYHEHYAEEIDPLIEGNNTPIEELAERYPMIDISYL